MRYEYNAIPNNEVPSATKWDEADPTYSLDPARRGV
jgi:hypothetical protein